VPAADKVVVLTQSFWNRISKATRVSLGAHCVSMASHLRSSGSRLAFSRRSTPASGWSTRCHGPRSANRTRRAIRRQLFGRIKPTASLGDAGSQVAALDKKYYDGASPDMRDFYDRTSHLVRVDTVQSQRVEPVKTSLFLLQGGVLFVLLIGCVNVANLLLAPIPTPEAENLPCGWRWARVGAQSCGSCSSKVRCSRVWARRAGFCSPGSGLSSANHFAAQLLPDARPFGLDIHVLGYTRQPSPCSGLVRRVAAGPSSAEWKTPGPADQPWHVSQSPHPGDVAASSPSPRLAFAFVLLTGAGLSLRSFANVLAVEPGFDPQQVIGARIAVRRKRRRASRPGWRPRSWKFRVSKRAWQRQRPSC